MVLLQKSTNPFKSRTPFGILIGIFGIPNNDEHYNDSRLQQKSS